MGRVAQGEGRSRVMSQLPADIPLAMLHQMFFRFTQPMDRRETTVLHLTTVFSLRIIKQN